MLKIADIEHPLTELPFLPTVVSRLLAFDPEGEAYFEKVLELAREDPPFAVRIMNLSNSAFSHPMEPITRLESAIARVGADEIARLVSNMAVARVFFPATASEKALWIHAVQVAVAAREIANAYPTIGVDPEEAYLCGLLHDIGRFVVFEKAADELKAVDEHNWTSPAQLVEIELQTYGFDHAQLGWTVCNHWGVPSRIATLIKYHHQKGLPREIVEDRGLAHLINVIQIADFFSVFMMLNPDLLEMDAEELLVQLDEKCIMASCLDSPVSASQLLELAPKILEESDEMIAKLGILPTD